MTAAASQFPPIPVPSSTNGAGAQSPQTSIPAVPMRGPDDPFVTPIEAARSYFVGGAGILPSSATAYQQQPLYQARMREDADIEGILRALLVAIAGMSTGISPREEWRNDAEAIEAASRILRVWRTIPRPSEILMGLGQASWYGCAAVNMLYARDPMVGIRVLGANHFHPDTIAFNTDGAIGIRVGAAYQQHGGKPVAGINSMVKMLEPWERNAMILHRVFVRAGEFDDPYAAERQFRGVGAREPSFWLWMLKQEALRSCANFLEIYSSGGIIAAHYPDGNAQAKTAMEAILKTIRRAGGLTIPRMPGGDEAQTYKIEVLPLSGSVGTLYQDLIDWIGRKLKECVLGQSLSSEASGGGGLGQGTAMMHANTLRNCLLYHATALGESLTSDFVRPVGSMLEIPPHVLDRIEQTLSVPRVIEDSFVSAVCSLVDKGALIPEREVLDRIGLREPLKGERVLQPTNADPIEEALRGAGAEGAD